LVATDQIPAVFLEAESQHPFLPSHPWVIRAALLTTEPTSTRQKRTRLNCISHLLSFFPYQDLTPEIGELGKRNL